MRHRLKGSKLGRTASHRKATLRSLSIALITHHRIVTTLTKAKELRRHVEPVINRGKEDTTHNRREAFSFLQDNKSVSKLFDEIGPKVADRPGGFTRVVKLGTRRGDSAEMAVIELVDYNESDSNTSTSKKKKRTRRAGKVTKTTAVAEVETSTESIDEVSQNDLNTPTLDENNEQQTEVKNVEDVGAETEDSTDTNDDKEDK
jgi:large subunit ribosomal protein L17